MVTWRDFLSELDQFVKDTMTEVHLPGLAVCLVKNGRIAWANGYGWANLEQQLPMTPETLMNVGSITKTVTATAVMQLWEQRKFTLADDISDYLPFRVRNPFHSNQPITWGHLLTHTSSIKDGLAYSESYACGDPAKPLGFWLQQYLTPEGALYQEQENFYDWEPGACFSYSNVGFGVLGYLVETISGTPFAQYCKAHIFEPLGMQETCWYLRDLQPAKHAVPYTYVANGDIHGVQLRDPTWTGGGGGRAVYVPHCLYGFPTLPDGLLRTTASELARFLMAYLDGGIYADRRILKLSTIQKMLSEEVAAAQQLDISGVGSGIYGLGWYAQRLRSGELVWGHGGGDPGISTLMFARLSDRVGTIVLANAYENKGGRRDITEYLFQHAAEF